MQERIDWIDTCRCIAIMFVILSHTQMVPFYLQVYLHSVTVPIFFMISGLLFSHSLLKKDIKIIFIELFKKRMIPYFIYGGICYFFLITIFILKKYEIYSGREINNSIFTPLFGMIYGVDNGMMLHNPALWFLPCMFATELYFYFAKKILKSNVIIIGFIFLCLITHYFIFKSANYRLPFSADAALITIGFYSIGALYRNYFFKIRIKFFTVILFFFIGTFLALFNGGVDVNYNKFGNVFLFYISGFVNSCLVIQIAKLIRSSRFLILIGQNTLLIMGLHIPAFYALNLLARLSPYRNFLNETNFLYGFLYCLSAIILLIPVIRLKKKYLSGKFI